MLSPFKKPSAGSQFFSAFPVYFETPRIAFPVRPKRAAGKQRFKNNWKGFGDTLWRFRFSPIHPKPLTARA
jgi:hypothetical protein